MVKRIAVFVYGVIAYATFFGTFLYAIGFVANAMVPKSLDSGREGSLAEAVLVNLGLLMLFTVQHSVMARPAFKRACKRVIPEPIERSTYVLASSLALILLFWQWRPMGGIVWQVDAPLGRLLAYALCAAGWATVLGSTLLINHFDLFGLRQTWLYLRGQPYTPIAFRTPGLYRWVRHPLYVGWLLAFWATPTMSAAHLVFALATTGYILAAIQLEERDLIAVHGDEYRRYRRRVPMLIPWPARKSREAVATARPAVDVR
jgi:protein-S-isoprenylcysteine O-methyltransferase Ste14